MMPLVRLDRAAAASSNMTRARPHMIIRASRLWSFSPYGRRGGAAHGWPTNPQEYARRPAVFDPSGLSGR